MNKSKSSHIKAGVVFLCHDGKGNFLMSLRGEHSRDNHGLWDPGSGQIVFGEKSFQTLKRELMEEYAVSPLKLTFMGVRENVNEKNHWISFDYLVEVEKKLVKNKEIKKLIKLEWFKFTDLPIKDSHPLFKDFLQKNEKFIAKII